MTPTPEMIEAAARAICINNGSDLDGNVSNIQGYMGANWRAYEDDARAALKAALAAMWRPIGEAPKDGTIIAVRLSENTSESDLDFYCYNKTSRISYGWAWENGNFRPASGLSIPVFVTPTHFIPLSIFEERK